MPSVGPLTTSLAPAADGGGEFGAGGLIVAVGRGAVVAVGSGSGVSVGAGVGVFGDFWAVEAGVTFTVRGPWEQATEPTRIRSRLVAVRKRSKMRLCKLSLI